MPSTIIPASDPAVRPGVYAQRALLLSFSVCVVYSLLYHAHAAWRGRPMTPDSFITHVVLPVCMLPMLLAAIAFEYTRRAMARGACGATDDAEAGAARRD